jgi:hypothetical protein
MRDGMWRGACAVGGARLLCWARDSRGNGHSSVMAMACKGESRATTTCSIGEQTRKNQMSKHPSPSRRKLYVVPQHGGGYPRTRAWSSDHSSASASCARRSTTLEHNRDQLGPLDTPCATCEHVLGGPAGAHGPPTIPQRQRSEHPRPAPQRTRRGHHHRSRLP